MYLHGNTYKGIVPLQVFFKQTLKDLMFEKYLSRVFPLFIIIYLQISVVFRNRKHSPFSCELSSYLTIN